MDFFIMEDNVLAISFPAIESPEASQELLINSNSEENDIAAKLQHWAYYAQKGLAKNTIQSIKSDFYQFTAFCQKHDYSPLPADPKTIEKFILANKEKKPATISRYLSSISTIHKASELPNPCASTEAKMTLRMIKREKGIDQSQAPALRYEALQKVLEVLEKQETLTARRNAALLSVAYDAMLRVSEVAAIKTANITPTFDGSEGGILLINKSKTDQTGEGAALYLSGQSMTLVRQWMKSANIDTNDGDTYLFRGVKKAGYKSKKEIVLPGKASVKTIERVFSNASTLLDDAPVWTGHSARIGAAQDLALDGYSLPNIQHTGRWKSPAMVARYIRNITATNSAMAQFRKNRKK